MKKMTKKDKVENYLEDLLNTDGFTAEDLMNMTVYDLFGNAELEGIGKTTLSGVLNSFKKKYGLKKQGKDGLIPLKNTKKERVERYLTKLMKSSDFDVEDLMNLTVYDLFGNSELEGIGKTTLSSGISAFKKKYLKIQYANENEDLYTEEGAEESFEDDETSFEDAFISAISKENQVDDNVKSVLSTNGNKLAIGQSGALNENDIHTLKHMIDSFKKGQMSVLPSDNQELAELKSALQHFGIDYKMILDHYRKNSQK